VTSFFRDPQAFEILAEKAILPLLKAHPFGFPLRVWAPGCSTGEEAYSIAILCQECLETLGLTESCKVQIFATDLDEAAIAKARQGLYPGNIAADVSRTRLERFFFQEDGSYRVRKDIREMLIFAPHNLLQDPPFTKLDLLSCRNLLIYLTPDTQKKLLPMFHYALNPNGFLFLGSSETIGELSDLFATVDMKGKLFARRAGANAMVGSDRMTVAAPIKIAESHGAQRIPGDIENAVPALAQRMLLEQFSPPAALIRDSGEIIYINGRTGKYLELPAGKVNTNLFALAREGLRLELPGVIHQAIKQQQEVVLKGLKIKTNGDDQTLDLLVRPIQEPPELSGLLWVVFKEVEAPPKPATPRRRRAKSDAATQDRTVELEAELKSARDRLQAVIEEMQASKEELQSTNEEMQSTNEELQSTNEELTTSREEMQSLNEELLTVNAELQNKNEALSQAYDDMKNLLNGTEIATLFLDNNLNIRRFTPQITRVINLREADIGRPVAEIVPNLKFEEFIRDVKQVMETLIYRETQVQTKDDQWYLMRIMPYRTLANVIDGAVITFMDITPLKQLEKTMREQEILLKDARAFAENIIATLREPLLILDTQMRVVSANRSYYQLFRTTPRETEKQPVYDLGNGQWNLPELKRQLEEILPQQKELLDLRIEQDFPGIGHRILCLNARELRQQNHQSPLILLAIEDITASAQSQPGGSIP